MGWLDTYDMYKQTLDQYFMDYHHFHTTKWLFLLAVVSRLHSRSWTDYAQQLFNMKMPSENSSFLSCSNINKTFCLYWSYYQLENIEHDSSIETFKIWKLPRYPLLKRKIVVKKFRVNTDNSPTYYINPMK